MVLLNYLLIIIQNKKLSLQIQIDKNIKKLQNNNTLYDCIVKLFTDNNIPIIT